jgi:hypothetical protein
MPSTPLIGASVTAPVLDRRANDWSVLELVYYPGRTDSSVYGPGSTTQLETSTVQGYGVYEARIRTASAGRGVGLVSGFFTYFNDGMDYDGDSIVDNHEIDYEFLADEPSTIYMTVWTAYQPGPPELFRKVTRKVDIASGRVWETPPGGEGTYDLVEVSSLGWNQHQFRASQRYHKYRFDWEATQVVFSIDLEDGASWRTLFTLSGAPNTVIPTHQAPLFLNLWHNSHHWDTGVAADPPRVPAHYRLDYVVTP